MCHHFLSLFLSPSVSLAHWPAVNYPTSFSHHLFFRGAEGLAERSCFPSLAPVIGYRTMFNLMAVNFLQPWTEALRSIKNSLSKCLGHACGSFSWWSWQTLSGIPPLHLIIWRCSGHTCLSALTILSGVINKTKRMSKDCVIAWISRFVEDVFVESSKGSSIA